ncbi:UNVERIFIED_CONTAM: hypothetical protein GTU68_023088 [Idotea baltica]|nr:hypothetical protein [Idotea baltica]
MLTVCRPSLTSSGSPNVVVASILDPRKFPAFSTTWVFPSSPPRRV